MAVKRQVANYEDASTLTFGRAGTTIMYNHNISSAFLGHRSGKNVIKTLRGSMRQLCDKCFVLYGLMGSINIHTLTNGQHQKWKEIVYCLI